MTLSSHLFLSLPTSIAICLEKGTDGLKLVVSLSDIYFPSLSLPQAFAASPRANYQPFYARLHYAITVGYAVASLGDVLHAPPSLCVTLIETGRHLILFLVLVFATSNT